MSKFFEMVQKILSEGKAEELRERYKDKVREETLDKVFEIGKTTDATNPNKYTQWMLKMLTDHKANQGMRDVDMINVFTTDIPKFDEYCKKNKIENKDLMSYPSVERLVDAVRTVEYKAKTELSRSQQKKGIEGLEEIPAEDIKFENDKCLVVFPTNTSFSCKYGRGTNWCTAAMGSRNYFNNYHFGKGANLYYLYSKVDISDKQSIEKDIVSKFAHDYKQDEPILAIVVYTDGNVEYYNKQDNMSSKGDPTVKKLFKLLGLPM